MPKKKKYSKKRKSRLVIRRSPLPFRFPCKLKYEEVFTIDPGLGSVGVSLYSANGLFDPTTAVGGHQPRGYDQIQALYDHYVVVGSKIICKFMGSNGNTAALTCFVALRDSTTQETTINDYVEGTKCFHKNIIQSSSTTGQCTIRCNFSPKRFLGRSKPMADPELKGSVAANPTEGAFYHVGAGGVSLSVNPSPILAQVFIEYIAIFVEPKNPTQS